MIYVISLKQFEEEKKKLAKAKEYILASSETEKLNRYSKVVSMQGFGIADKYLKSDDKKIEDFISKDNKMIRKFFKTEDFKAAVRGVVKSFIDNNGEINIFIIVRGKIYKMYAKKMVKAMNKVIDYDGKPFIFTFDDIEDDKKILEKNPKSKVMNKIQKSFTKSLPKTDL
jgi:vacuolar-type H+-ATPase subunit E/Vma4